MIENLEIMVIDMKKPVLVFKLDACETFQLMRPVNGQGGWQDFLRKIQKKVESSDGDILLYLEDEDIGRAMRGMTGDGGFQSRLKKVFASQFINFLETV